MSDPNYRQFLINRYEMDKYWTCKWMRTRSYCAWAASVQTDEQLWPETNLPGMSMLTYYRLEFQVDGVDYACDGPDGIKVTEKEIDWEATQGPSA